MDHGATSRWESPSRQSSSWFSGLESFRRRLAYDAGYRTAFMNLNQGGNRGPDQNEYFNGNTVFQQLVAVTNHYKVANVVVITHSKGGIDIQDALASQTAGPLVSEVFMLSAPNLGSKLARSNARRVRPT